jgi:hypothetical protein
MEEKRKNLGKFNEEFDYYGESDEEESDEEPELNKQECVELPLPLSVDLNAPTDKELENWKEFYKQHRIISDSSSTKSFH